MKKPDGTSTYIPCTTAGGTVTYPAWTVPQEYRDLTTGSAYTATVTQIRYLTGYSAASPGGRRHAPRRTSACRSSRSKRPDRSTTRTVRGTETVTITKRNATGDL